MAKFEVYPKDPEMIRQLEPKVEVIWVRSTSRRGLLGGRDCAAEEMVERLVPLLNAPVPEVETGRYSVVDGYTFRDTGEIVRGKPGDSNVGEPVCYRLENHGQPLPPEFAVRRLVGMLNRSEKARTDGTAC